MSEQLVYITVAGTEITDVWVGDEQGPIERSGWQIIDANEGFETIECGQLLSGDGKWVLCTQKYGVEHSHHDMRVSEMIEKGLAKELHLKKF